MHLFMQDEQVRTVSPLAVAEFKDKDGNIVDTQYFTYSFRSLGGAEKLQKHLDAMGVDAFFKDSRLVGARVDDPSLIPNLKKGVSSGTVSSK